jgi:hypothetical protein
LLDDAGQRLSTSAFSATGPIPGDGAEVSWLPADAARRLLEVRRRVDAEDIFSFNHDIDL